ncbi:GNAT family N-acetyltransferase [Desulfonatronum sp. SC1]|uniref:GNAT family N-acetyltransferase n=1 Tax=Desulfonatronum sp. SC1 TaxID=2109626 RepID=UPI000D31E28A|nr:GNAT family N-acetyltransferase [Desulfonatronum sp. SC1]PTN36784.1 N-acetyltransferase [Desulfonatronum sp. SC1]
MNDLVALRGEVRAEDIPAIAGLAGATGFFTAQEVAVAAELAEERLNKGPASGYHFLFAEDAAKGLMGYACFGPIPCTIASFDLYWIIVDPRRQGHGLGKRLIQLAEAEIQALGGTRVYIETSSRDLYHPTRRFYERCGYALEAVLKDFYAPGDDKLIYCKSLPAARA